MSEPTTPKEWWDIHTEWHGDWSREDLVEQVWSDATEIATRAERERCAQYLDAKAEEWEQHKNRIGIARAATYRADADTIREADNG